jgi:excinuclease ABC subunit C
LDILQNLPSYPGVYKFKDKFGHIIYVGASKNLKKRVSSYFQIKFKNSRLSLLVNSISSIDFEIIQSPNSAFLRERELINIHKPKFNIRWMDDKQYPYLMITKKEKYPRINIIRTKKDDNNIYFGRQATLRPLRDSLKYIRKVFPICDCSQPSKPNKNKRPCLNFDLGLCSAPCALKISMRDYQENIDQLVKFLSGETGLLLNQWKSDMNIAASNMEFEKAAKIRDRITSVKEIKNNSKDYYQENSYDVIGYARAREVASIVVLTILGQKIIEKQEYFIKEQELLSLDEFIFSGLKIHYQDKTTFPMIILLPFSLNDLDYFFEWINQQSNHNVKIQVFSNPNDNKWLKIAMKSAYKSISRNVEEYKQEYPNFRQIETELNNILNHTKINILLIECVDISTLHGSNTVGSVIAAKNGVFFKKYYRRYQVKSISNKQNDIGSMKEVLMRHFNRKKIDKLEYPDVLLIDGGKSQLSAVKSVFKTLNLNIPYLGLAKKEEDVYVPNKKLPIKLKKTSPTLKLLVSLRDEAHRFAITYHRKKRQISSIRNELETIRGIGKEKRRMLLAYFGSISNIKKASITELIKVPGINERLAQEIMNFYDTKKNKQNK